jgi:hypothetical protein
MGKKDKEHRKNLAKRNELLKCLWKKLSENAWAKHEEWKKQKELDGQNTDNQSVPRFNITGQKD